MVKNIAIIPARKGSKRVHNKNIYPFKGKPLMAWVIEAALQSGVFDKVMVSTDSEEYAQIARQYGAWVPFLRDSYSDDRSTVRDVLRSTLRRLRDEFNMEFDNVASLQPTCPLIKAEIIREVYENFLRKAADRMRTCCKFAFMNPWWAFKMENAQAHFVLSSPAQSRSQDNPQLYCPTGALTITKIACFDSESTLFYEIDWQYAVDIDTYEDIAFANLLYDYSFVN